jgi:hypothetical protein
VVVRRERRKKVCARGALDTLLGGRSSAALDSGMPWSRAVAAFLVAPAVGILTAWLIAFCVWAMPFGFATSLVLLAYGVTLVVAVPAFFLARWWNLGFTALWWYVVAGFLVACCATVPYWGLAAAMPSVARNLIAIIAVSGITAGLAFGLIWRPKSNHRWRGP